MDHFRTNQVELSRDHRFRTFTAGRRFVACCCGVVIGLSNATAWAHTFTQTDVLVVLKKNGTFVIDMTVDVDALALGVPDSTESEEVFKTLRALNEEALTAAIEHAGDTIVRRVRIRCDREKVIPTVSFPDYGTAVATESVIPTLLGTTARLSGVIPENAAAFSFGASRAFQAVHLTVFEESTGRVVKEWLGPSEDSSPLALGATTGVASSTRDVIGRYLVLGFEHILPLGLDHILFVLGLFLLSPKLKPLLWQITAFTLAHSVTLGLSIYEVVSLPPRLVESLIALSIAYVAIENVFTSELKPWRPVIVFLFGLLHGLGFAGVLRELGLPTGDFMEALISFNVGVELGQISVVLLALLLVGWARGRPRYRSVVVVPASILIAAVGLYWSVERAFLGS